MCDVWSRTGAWLSVQDFATLTHTHPKASGEVVKLLIAPLRSSCYCPNVAWRVAWVGWGSYAWQVEMKIKRFQRPESFKDNDFKRIVSQHEWFKSFFNALLIIWRVVIADPKISLSLIFMYQMERVGEGKISAMFCHLLRLLWSSIKSVQCLRVNSFMISTDTFSALTSLIWNPQHARLWSDF